MTRIRLAIFTTVFLLPGLIWTRAVTRSEEPPPKKELTAEQKQKLKERDRYAQETAKLRQQGKLLEAIAAAEKMLAIEREVLGNVHDDVVGSLRRLSGMYAALEDFAAAKTALQEVLDIKTKLFGESHWQVTDAKLELADVDVVSSLSAADRRQLAEAGRLNGVVASLCRQGKFQEAPKPAQEVVRIAKQLLGEKHRNYATSLNELAYVYKSMGDYAKAEPLYRQALEIRKQVTQKKEELERTLAQRSAAYRHGQALVQLTPRQVQNLLPPRTVLVDLLEYQHSSADAKIKGKFNKEHRLVAFVLDPSGPVDRVDLGSVKPITEAVDAWRNDFGQRTAGGLGAAEATLRQLVWAPLEPHLMDATTVLISPDGALTRFPFGALPGKEPGKYLIEELAIAVVPVPKLLPELLANSEVPAEPSLLLVGDVDYGADPGKGINVVSAQTAAGKDRAALLGKSSSLAGTRAEILAIKDSFQERFPGALVTDLRKAKATENEVRKQAPVHRYLHFATHGFFAPKELKSALAIASPGQKPGDLFAHQGVSGWNPGLLSGIVLAGANQPLDPSRDDGILTALEVAELDLNKVELAVLSACETGLGETAGGEGILGLQRAFQVAGAKSVVASLWKVDDKCTRDLMVRFYENLWQKKMSKLEALREAQMWMLKEGGSRGLEFSKDQQPDRAGRLPPYYWAGFVLSGDWR